MKRKKELQRRFGQAVQFLPPRFRDRAMRIDSMLKEQAEEFRLRAGQHMTVLLPSGEIEIEGESPVRHEELNAVLELATGGSVHSSADSIKRGFITVPGGHRIGVCGTAVTKNKELIFIKDISSVSVRIAKEFTGCADELAPQLIKDGRFENTLIISPPGYGKTTLLRDLIRVLSNSFRIAVADERGEIAAKYRGIPQFDIGKRTDVMEGVNKASAMLVMLRAMSPQIIAADEITAEEDVYAIESAANCGVGLLATAHGENVDSLYGRRIYRRLLDQDIFRFAVIIKKRGSVPAYVIEELSRKMSGDTGICSK